MTKSMLNSMFPSLAIQHDKIHDTHNTLPHSGHPKAVDDHKCCQALCEVHGNHHATFADIAESLSGITACQIQTIHGLHHCVIHRKPFLCAANVKKQLAWTKANEQKDWDKVIWTNKAKIELGECPGCQYVTCGPGEEFLPKNIHLP